MSYQPENRKKFFIHTLGCKVNQYESQAMREILVRSGFKECVSKAIADIYILNTCTVTDRADKESRYWIGFFHKANPKARIIVTGCYAERNSDEISFLPGVSNILKNDEKSRIAEFLTDNSGPRPPDPGSRSPAPGPLTSVLRPSLSITDFKGRTKAFVKIQDGCENGCAYCKVPLVRGVLRSRPINEIAEEVRVLVDKGFREIVLTGICLGAWGKDIFPEQLSWEVGLKRAAIPDVLKILCGIKGEFRIRLSSIEPKYVDDELIDFIAGNRKMCRHLHIPFQSGDDEILRKMNRPYTGAGYRLLAKKVKDGISGVSITTDMLIGFPGETDDSFRNSVNFIKEVLPLRTHIFTFSRRKDTAAYTMVQDVSRGALKKRYYELRAATLGASYIYRSGFLNNRLNVLVETKREKYSGLLTGYSDNYIKILFEGRDDLMKKIVTVRVSDMNLMHTMGVHDS